MRVLVLGSAAGGGVPQWNCSCDNCFSARVGAGVKVSTQDSLAVSPDGKRWVLLNASPDVARQIERHVELQPAPKAARAASWPRQSAIAGVVLTNGDLDHCLGLLCLREWTPFSLYATRETQVGLVEHNAMFRTLSRQSTHVVFRSLCLDQSLPLLDAWGEPTGLLVRAFSVPGKVPLHLEQLMAPSSEVNVGVIVEAAATGARIAYVPAAGSLAGLAEQVRGVSCLFFDGTFWQNDELVRLGLSGKTAEALAHVPISGPGGSLGALPQLPVLERVYVHINNTNPILKYGSPERALVDAQGITIAEDGMEMRL